MAEQEKQEAPKATQLQKWRRRAALLGAIVALICHALPHEYRAVCQAVATVCTGGF